MRNMDRNRQTASEVGERPDVKLWRERGTGGAERTAPSSSEAVPSPLEASILSSFLISVNYIKGLNCSLTLNLF